MNQTRSQRIRTVPEALEGTESNSRRRFELDQRLDDLDRELRVQSQRIREQIEILHRINFEPNQHLDHINQELDVVTERFLATMFSETLEDGSELTEALPSFQEWRSQRAGEAMVPERLEGCFPSSSRLFDPVLPTAVQNPRQKDVDLLCLDLIKLYRDGNKQDLILRVGDKDFHVHQNILMARSDVFEATLTHDMLEKNKGVVYVPDCDPEDMEQLLCYVYSGKVERLDKDNVFGLYYLADKYNMMFLRDLCSEFVKKSLSASIISEVIQLAMKHNDNELLESATDYFANHVSDILPTTGWMSFMKSDLTAANELLIKASKKWSCPKS